LDEDSKETLIYAAVLYESGLSISHSQHHQHGAYIVANCDLAGFSRDEQQALALLIRCHRRSLPDRAESVFEGVPERMRESLRRLAIILRLAVVLQRGRELEPAAVKLVVQGGSLKLRFQAHWLEQHPLTRADLQQERGPLEKLGVKLVVASAAH
jgi:exopolyphosphatase / guanosine-5'-triphosphate,3'-diphosphate pyrophosphatase